MYPMVYRMCIASAELIFCQRSEDNFSTLSTIFFGYLNILILAPNFFRNPH